MAAAAAGDVGMSITAGVDVDIWGWDDVCGTLLLTLMCTLSVVRTAGAGTIFNGVATGGMDLDFF